MHKSKSLYTDPLTRATQTALHRARHITVKSSSNAMHLLEKNNCQSAHVILRAKSHACWWIVIAYFSDSRQNSDSDESNALWWIDRQLRVSLRAYRWA